MNELLCQLALTVVVLLSAVPVILSPTASVGLIVVMSCCIVGSFTVDYLTYKRYLRNKNKQ